MKVILLKDVGGVGQQGTVKDVSDGHALNLLIPRGLAVQATPERLAAYKKKQEEMEAARQKAEAALGDAVRGLNRDTVELKIKATEKGGLFKSVGAEEIVKAIAAQKKISIPSSAIKLEKPIKTTGAHPVSLSAAGAKAELLVVILAS